MKNYLEHKLQYTTDGRLIDERGHAVMMDWEKEWMYESAKIICGTGGDILNIGFGMGIIDSFIETYPINSHTIIEAHPDVYSKMIEDGWDKKPNVKIIFGKWQDVINDLPKFDGIYFDTWEDDGFYEIFLPHLKNILKENGVFSYWEGISFQIVNGGTTDILYKEFEFDKKILTLNNIPSKKEQYESGKGFYFNPDWNQCVIPIIRHRKNEIVKTII